MAEPFLAEIRLFSFAFAPRGWAQCNGQLLAINQNQALFSLMGTLYGGNGQTNFALPDIRNRVLVGFGPGFDQGQVAGEAAHTLTTSEMPSHTHNVQASSKLASFNNPAGHTFSNVGPVGIPNPGMYSPSGADSSALILSQAGSSQPHENRQPTLVMNYCVALQGIFPSRN